MSELPLARNDLHKAEMEYHGKFGLNLGHIQHISIMIRIGIFYTAYHMVTKTVVPNLPNSNISSAAFDVWIFTPIKPYFILLIIMMAKLSSYLHGVGIKWKTAQPRVF